MSLFRILHIIFLILLSLEVESSMGQKDEDDYIDRQEPVAIIKYQITVVTLIIYAVFIFIGGLAMAVFLLACSILNTQWIRHRRYRYFVRNGGKYLPSPQERQFTAFTPEEIEIATAYFSNKRLIGKGGQGSVYEGMLEDGRPVAIKVANSVSPSLRESFIYEALFLTELNHSNIIPLYGFCLDTQKPTLVYEFIEGKTLGDYIFKKSKFEVSWEVVRQIITDVADALKCMHGYDKYAVYHRDIKPNNILLDEDDKAYLADFGLAKLNDTPQANLNFSKLEGTRMFICPEFFRTLEYNEKSDVYSFGVVMVEMLTGDSIYNNKLKKRFFKAVEENNRNILDLRIFTPSDEDEIWRFAQLAQLCIRKVRDRRPTTEQVLAILKGGAIDDSLRDYTEEFTDSDDSLPPFEPWEDSSSTEEHPGFEDRF